MDQLAALREKIGRLRDEIAHLLTPPECQLDSAPVADRAKPGRHFGFYMRACGGNDFDYSAGFSRAAGSMASSVLGGWPTAIRQSFL